MPLLYCKSKFLQSANVKFVIIEYFDTPLNNCVTGFTSLQLLSDELRNECLLHFLFERHNDLLSGFPKSQNDVI